MIKNESVFKNENWRQLFADSADSGRLLNITSIDYGSLLKKAQDLAQKQLQKAMKAIEVQNEEIKTRMADGEKTIEILSDKSLEHDEKINRLNELAAQESKRVDAFEKQMNSFEIKLNQHTREIQVIN